MNKKAERQSKVTTASNPFSKNAAALIASFKIQKIFVELEPRRQCDHTPNEFRF